MAIKRGRRYTTKSKEYRDSTYYWWFRCDCGTEKEILISNVTRKTKPTKSCGCLSRKATSHLGSKERVAFLRNGLRRLSMKWPPRYHTKAAARLSRGLYRCAGYERDAHEVRAKEVDVDHIVPVGPIEDWNSHIDALFCGSNNLQVLCRECHKQKTQDERSRRSKK